LGEPKKRVVPGQKLSPSALSYVIRKSMQQVLLKKLLEKEDGWTGIQNQFRVTGQQSKEVKVLPKKQSAPLPGQSWPCGDTAG
jgi:hypothetical protein